MATPTETPDELLTPAQASALIGVSVQTLRRYDREGRLPAARTPGNQRRFRRSDVLGLVSTDGAA